MRALVRAQYTLIYEQQPKRDDGSSEPWFLSYQIGQDDGKNDGDRRFKHINDAFDWIEAHFQEAVL